MVRRIYLHVGTPKTGTTYLQSVLWANRDALARQGLLLPLKGVREHFYLSVTARGSAEAKANMPPAGHTAWNRMIDEVKRSRRDVLISHELFSAGSMKEAAWVHAQLRPLCQELHIVVTARDMGRQVPAEWQQTVKHGRDHTLPAFYDTLRRWDPDEPTRPPLKSRPPVLFWQVQDLVAVLDRWGAGLPREHIHIVTVPPRGADKRLLWSRFAQVVNVDPESVDQSVTTPNESLGVAEIELVRRVNTALPADLPRMRQQKVVKGGLADTILAARAGMRKFAPSAQDYAWSVKRGTQMVEALRPLGYDVVGDLDDLIPAAQPPGGASVDDVTEGELNTVAVQTIVDLLLPSDAPAARGMDADPRRARGKIGDQQRRTNQQAKTLEQARQERRGGAHRLLLRLRRAGGKVKRLITRRR
ncbi:MAG TPA: hypothetical protein VH419_13310 [Nocardioidaceae bacterium]|jgi:hypothetical protein